MPPDVSYHKSITASMDPPVLCFPVTPNPKKAIRRVALACIQCRSRKVKCDATTPSCKRCQADEKSCEYQRSRRGARPRRPPPAPLAVAVEDPHFSESSSPWAEIFATGPASSSSGNLSIGRSMHSSSGSPEIGVITDNLSFDSTLLTSVQVDQLLTQYYAHFHTSHPCVLPRWSLKPTNTLDSAATWPLIPVLLFIGSLFTPSVPSTPLAEAAEQSIMYTRPFCGLPSPYYVQALTLHAIAVYWCDEPERARELLDEAIRGASDLGMHKAEFAVQHGLGDPMLEESWRRTWWQLYVTDAHIAGSTHSYPTKTVALKITADLPCEEAFYESGNIPSPTPLRAYDIREFSDVDFSSFAQLIGFTRGINKALVNARYGDIENAKLVCANADVMMTAWCSLLPKSKRTLLRGDGSLDELLFKANMLMLTYMVDLHRQLSTLKYLPIESVSKCAPPPPPDSNQSIKDDAPLHTAKVLFATEKLNGLLTLPTRFSTHTPFIICMLSNMTIAHLSACRHVFREPRLSLEREKIRLNMGVLKMMGEFWPSGAREYRKMGIIAREVLSLQDEDIQVPQESPTIPLHSVNLDFDFNAAFDICDLFGHSGHMGSQLAGADMSSRFATMLIGS
ncbi:hypothetical protein BDV96DRAFT_202238 [Lophiotrema nucula]|uniref:Zn(2)-C6 fungal-type domain-containing protein n=1 Tax=Lophiotrema nucula TaxID=690887 RepID=A0A6A5YTI6_9PLEO|nr:hypothetical protein BDV96DRAFT_202238 [Lophiotrema nucula]